MSDEKKYVKYGKREFLDKVRYQDPLKGFEDYEVLAGFNETDDGTDEWFLIKEEDTRELLRHHHRLSPVLGERNRDKAVRQPLALVSLCRQS